MTAQKIVQGENYTLYLGDCLDIMPTLEAGSVDMIWIDPPYGHSNHDGDLNDSLNKLRSIESKPIENDDADSMRRVVSEMLRMATGLLKNDCCCCCCCGGGGPRPTFAWLAQRMDTGGLEFFHSVIWDKKNPGLGWRYRRQHEMVMIAKKEGAKLLWNENSSPARNIYSQSPPRSRVHPNEKPILMVEHFLKNHCDHGSLVLDPFMGSGTTGVASANLDLRFIGIEKDPEYFEIACERIRNAYGDFTLTKKEKEKGQLSLFEVGQP